MLENPDNVAVFKSVDRFPLFPTSKDQGEKRLKPEVLIFAQEGADEPGSGLFVVMPSIGGAENAA